MRRLATTCALFCALGASSTGCATYWKNRAKDFIDPFGFGFDFDFRLGVNLRVTQFVQVGAAGGMVMERPIIRFVGRHGFSESTYVEVGFAPIYHYRQVNEQMRKIVLGRVLILEEPHVTLTYAPEKRDYEVTLSRIEDEKPAPDRKSFEQGYDRRIFDIGVSAHAIAGVDAEFNPFELVDFFLGWFGVDIAGDDAPLTSPLPPPDSYNAEALVRLFASEDLALRGAAFSEVKRLGSVATEALCQGLKDEKSGVRFLSAQSLRLLSSDLSTAEVSRLAHLAVPALAEGLKDDDPNVRWTSADALGNFGAAALPLSNALRALRDNDPDQNVRYFAANALARIGAR